MRKMTKATAELTMSMQVSGRDLASQKQKGVWSDLSI